MTEPKVINATDLRNHMRDIIEQAKFKGRHYIVQTHGKPMIAIIGYEEYRELTQHEGTPMLNALESSLLGKQLDAHVTLPATHQLPAVEK